MRRIGMRGSDLWFWVEIGGEGIFRFYWKGGRRRWEMDGRVAGGGRIRNGIWWVRYLHH